jgi:hypothetical protein
MNNTKDTIEKAYGSIPKEVGISFDFFDWLTPRPLKYFWLKWVVRKFWRKI